MKQLKYKAIAVGLQENPPMVVIQTPASFKSVAIGYDQIGSKNMIQHLMALHRELWPNDVLVACFPGHEPHEKVANIKLKQGL